jgi:hypothetical protein
VAPVTAAEEKSLIVTMPNPVHVTKAVNLKMSGGQTDGMIRKVWPPSTKTLSQYTPSGYRHLPTSLSSLTGRNNIHLLIHLYLLHDGAPKICLNRPPPRAQDTIIYAASGHGTIVLEGEKKRQDLAPGDFALIPAYAEHQEVNDGNEEAVWVIAGSGSEPVVEKEGLEERGELRSLLAGKEGGICYPHC